MTIPEKFQDPSKWQSRHGEEVILIGQSAHENTDNRPLLVVYKTSESRISSAKLTENGRYLGEQCEHYLDLVPRKQKVVRWVFGIFYDNVDSSVDVCSTEESAMAARKTLQGLGHKVSPIQRIEFEVE